MADLRAALASDEVALKVLVASVVVLAVGWLGVKAAVGGVIASQVLSEAVKRWVERNQISTRRKWLISLLLLLLERAQNALAAVRRAFRAKPGRARSGALASVLAGVTTVTLFTAPELVLGDSLIDDRKTTFFGGAAEPAPTSPRLAMPRALIREATSPEGATVTFRVAVRDRRARATVVTCSPRSGSRFPLGTSTVSCSVAAPGGADADGAFKVTVADLTAPRLKLPPPIRVSTHSRAGAKVNYAAAASDAVSGRVNPDCRPRPRTRFALGTTTVVCAARDQADNTARGSFLVAVTRRSPGQQGHAGGQGQTGGQDRAAPTLSLLSSMKEEAVSARGARVTYRARAKDAVDGALVPTCSPKPGTLFAIGTHTVRCSVADSAGNIADKKLKVTVFDAPPIVSVPADIRKAYRPPYRKPGLTRVTYAASARDRIDGDLPADCSPRSPARLPLGDSAVTCTATDSAGQSTSKTFTVTILDTIAPTLTLKDITTYARSTVEVDYDRKHVSAFDAVDGAVKPDCDPPSGSTFRVSTTTTVNCAATDDAGNKSSGSFRVIVHQVVE